MLLQYLNSGQPLRMTIIAALLTLPTVLIALTVHEFAHGWMSNKLGDPTAKERGRLTLNPLAHLDPMGAVCMILFGFGWARPVPINSRYYKKPKAGVAVTALAGPVSNLIMALIGTLLYALTVVAIYKTGAYESMGFASNLARMALNFFHIFLTLNVKLAVFNLLPIPPLDGSRLMYSVLPNKIYIKFLRYERAIYNVLVVVILASMIFNIDIIWLPLDAVSGRIINGLMKLADIIFGWM
ncbi:MAG: site-2 protease family protein [Ruminococcaceae bacterium]|nr:site-2 protease family protein [Oscillospiraceae bacterium]